MKFDDSPRKDAAGFSILPLIENSPPAVSPKKSKKRKGDDMDVDEEEEEVPRKKVKLSKEEKKALKKELKQKRKEEEKAAGVRSLFFFSFFSSSLNLVLLSYIPCACDLIFDISVLTIGFSQERKEGEKREKRKGGKERRVGESCGWNCDRTAREEREEGEEEKEQGIIFMISRYFALAFFISTSVSAISQCVFYYTSTYASGIYSWSYTGNQRTSPRRYGPCTCVNKMVVSTKCMFVRVREASAIHASEDQVIFIQDISSCRLVIRPAGSQLGEPQHQP